MKEIKIPDEIMLFYGLSEEMLSRRVLFLVVSDLLRQGKLSRGKASELLDMSIYEILDLMSQQGIPAVSCSDTEFEEEWEEWKQIKSKMK